MAVESVSPAFFRPCFLPSRAHFRVCVSVACFFRQKHACSPPTKRPGAPRPNNHTSSRREWLVGLAAERGEANKPSCSRTCVVFWPWCPRPPKKHLAQKPLRCPFGQQKPHCRQEQTWCWRADGFTRALGGGGASSGLWVRTMGNRTLLAITPSF